MTISNILRVSLYVVVVALGLALVALGGLYGAVFMIYAGLALIGYCVLKAACREMINADREELRQLMSTHKP